VPSSIKSDKTPRNKPIVIDAINGYTKWAALYTADAHNGFMEIEEQAMQQLIPNVTGKVCLDLACGSGRYLRRLQQQASLAIGCDITAAMLQHARDYKLNNLVQCGFFPLPFSDNSFDLITCGLAVGHCDDLAMLLSEAARVLCKKGSIVYSDFHPFASLSGGHRIFTGTDGIKYYLEHYTHLYSDHFNACKASGLEIHEIIEPLGGPQHQHGLKENPVVIAIRAEKNTL